jgi:hypothetical protein
VDFLVHESNKPDHIVNAKIIRSDYDPSGKAPKQPIIEVDGKLQFRYPGEPQFTALGDDTILNPTLSWKLEASAAGKLDAELAYITRGLSWHADYNLVAPESSDVIDLVGWVSFSNQCGKTFENAKIKLMAGDVNKIEPEEQLQAAQQAAAKAAAEEPVVTEKAFSEYHLYTLSRRATLRDQETKQVEFVRAKGVRATRLFIYDGGTVNYGRYPLVRGSDENEESQSNPKVWVMREFKNTEANKLGMPLPKGRLRFYQQDTDKQLEFIGENEIDHTPKDETIGSMSATAST